MTQRPPNPAAALNALRRFVRGLRLAAQGAERTLGISAAQLFVLQQLADEPAESMKDLAARTHTDQSSVSVVVTRLEERGLVERAVSPKDARRTEVNLTRAGRTLVKRAPEAPQASMMSVLEALSQEELNAFVDVLDQIAGALGVAGQPAGMFFDEVAPPAPVETLIN